MNKILLFLVLCVASASCVELENLCSSDSFTYNGVVVNAFFKVPQALRFHSLSHYLIKDTVACDKTEFKNNTNLMEALKAKNVYNGKFSELYTESLTGNTPKQIQAKAQDLEIHGWLPLYELRKVEEKAKCLESFDDTAWSGFSLFSTLDRFANKNKHAISYSDGSMPKPDTAMAELNITMENLKVPVDGQTFAMKSEKALDVYFFKSIVLPKEFKFLNDKESMLTYEQFLPFNTKNHVDTNCVPAKDLPLFYKEKEK